jgi:hypothetical protein
MDSKKVIEKLADIVAKQQKIIQKLAQAVQLPGSGDVMVGGDRAPAVPSEPALPQHMAPQVAGKHDADLILAALPPAVKPAVAKLEVVTPNVMVTFHAGKATQQAYNAVKATVQNLQNTNKLTSPTPYNVKIVA